MNVWVILVTYGDFCGETNVNEGYKTYAEAKLAVMKKIGENSMFNIGDFIFTDKDENISYELKEVTIY